jgi:serpin B
MRILILVALCVAVATAHLNIQHDINRLLRQGQRQQQPGQGNQNYPTQGQYDDDYEIDENDDDYYPQQSQQQQCRGQQCELDNEQDQYNNDEQDDEDQDQQCAFGQCGRGQQQGQGQQCLNGKCGRGQQQQGQGQQCAFGQCSRGQRQGQRQHQRPGQHQQPQQQQHKKQTQQQNQCTPKFRLLQSLEEPNCQLASKLYKQAKQETDDKNTVVSPTAIQLALAAIKRGARGSTHRQIQRLLGAGLNQQQTHQAHAALHESLQGQDPLQQQQVGGNQQCQIKTTTTIILNQRNRAQQKFVQAVKACANADVKKCDFQNQAQQCRQQINRFVAQKTNNKLQQILPQDAVTSNTQLLIVSTAQVKAKWGRQFRQQQTTKQGKFYPLGSQQPKQVQVLQSQGQFNYYEDEQLQIVGVPTQQQELTLFVICPKDKDGLNQIEKQQIQNGQQLKQLLDQAEQQQEEVNLELPKIQIKHKIDAKQALRQEGLQDCFDSDQADFTGINGQQQQQQGQQQKGCRGKQCQDVDDEDQYGQQDQDGQQENVQQLHVNKLIHQATIKIDEQGISAVNSQNQPQQQGQYDEDDEQDEQAQSYRQKQYQREDIEEEIFGQRQGQGQGLSQRSQQRRRQPGQGQQGQSQRNVKCNRAFAFAIKHNASNQIVLVGRVVDAAQKPNQQGGQQQSLNGVDQQ